MGIISKYRHMFAGRDGSSPLSKFAFAPAMSYRGYKTLLQSGHVLCGSSAENVPLQ